MPVYKLLYMNGRGRAETARLMMAYGGIEYEDVRYNEEQREKVRPTTPMGQYPVLEIDGEMICQTYAIYRYVAKQAGLMGDSDLDVARIDMILGCLDDIYLAPIITFLFEKDEEKKKEVRKKFQDALPEETAKLEKLLKGQHFVGNKFSLADFATAQILTMAPALGFTLNLDDFPKLKAIQNKVFSHPKVAVWIKKRPETPY